MCKDGAARIYMELILLSHILLSHIEARPNWTFAKSSQIWIERTHRWVESEAALIAHYWRRMRDSGEPKVSRGE
jgi:hypothetical protein